jgi:hypothetical protein
LYCRGYGEGFVENHRVMGEAVNMKLQSAGRFSTVQRG